MCLCEDIRVYVNAHTIFHVFKLADIQIFNETLEQSTEVKYYQPAFLKVKKVSSLLNARFCWFSLWMQ